ncbi:MAG: hypothetical protein LBL00_04710 [Endomicrobium sp.]|jgi:hypothetical protein|nr:hypothetical protein [Endomicrobium sp.]
MDILQQDKEKALKMQTLPVVINVGRTLSQLLSREICIIVKSNESIYSSGTYNKNRDFQEYGKITIYIPKIALNFTEEEITAFAAAEYFFMAVSSHFEYTYGKSKTIFYAVYIIAVVYALFILFFFCLIIPGKAPDLSLTSILLYYHSLKFYSFESIVIFISFPIVSIIVLRFLGFLGFKEKSSPDKKAVELLGNSYNLISALEKILGSKVESINQHYFIFIERIEALKKNN